MCSSRGCWLKADRLDGGMLANGTDLRHEVTRLRVKAPRPQPEMPSRLLAKMRLHGAHFDSNPTKTAVQMNPCRALQGGASSKRRPSDEAWKKTQWFCLLVYCQDVKTKHTSLLFRGTAQQANTQHELAAICFTFHAGASLRRKTRRFAPGARRLAEVRRRPLCQVQTRLKLSLDLQFRAKNMS